MKIKLDENLPLGLVPRLRELGHDVHTPRDEGLRSAPDSAIRETAQREQRFLITQDLDFSDVRRFAPGTHQGLLLVRLTSRAAVRWLTAFTCSSVTRTSVAGQVVWWPPLRASSACGDPQIHRRLPLGLKGPARHVAQYGTQ